MAVGLKDLPTLHPVAGVEIAVLEAGVRYKNRRDLVVFALREGATVAALFTRNAFCAAPVQVARAHLAAAATRYLLINTGNANAGTGAAGMAACQDSCAALAAQMHVQPEQVLPFSTGVIGELLPLAPITAALPKVAAALRADAWNDAAVGIMTTDTRPKGAHRRFQVDGHDYTLTGITKGAGMIRPNMATMLAFIATDMKVEASLLQALLAQANATAFNRITIDGDTSTNDACVLVASGAAGGELVRSADSAAAQALARELADLMRELAQMIVRDGEGASKFITVQVEGGGSAEECCDVAYAVAHSPLVKTAFFASDPNWGRILAAIGRAGVRDLAVQGVQVWLDEVQICRDGGAAPDYRESLGAEVMRRPEITIRIDLGRGDHRDTVWTCDLSYDYVKINADYRS